MKPNNTFAALFAIMLLTAASALWAAAPSTVYRTDYRPPVRTEDGRPGIFSTGFHPWGENDNLVEHVEGTSLGIEGASGSAFVGTTTSLQFATSRFFTSLGETEFYVYEVRPTDNFYSVVLSFESWARSDPDYNDLLEDFSYQAEYAAFGGIAAEQILRATRYRVVNGQIIRFETVENPSYQRGATVANDGSYPYRHSSENIWNASFECARSSSSHLSLDKAAANDAESVPFDEKMKVCYRRLSSNAAISVVMSTDQ